MPSDLSRLILADADPFQWAEAHLRASPGFVFGPIRIPSVVPAKADNGQCHWHQDGKCTVHDDSPFGCAFFDQHQSSREAEDRAWAARDARLNAFRQRSLYAQLWDHLSRLGLVYSTGAEDRQRILGTIRRVAKQERRNIERQKQKRKKKALKKQRRLGM